MQNNKPANSYIVNTKRSDAVIRKLEANRSALTVAEDSTSQTQAEIIPQRAPEVQNIEDSITSMADNLLLPSKFLGLANEDANRWLSRLESYFIVKKIDGEQKAAIFSLLLEHSARDWFDALPETTQKDFGTLKTDFIKRYTTSNSVWKDVASIFSKSQSPSENLLDFIANIRRLAKQAKLPDEQTLQACLNGMHGSIRPFVLQKEPKNIQDLEAIARTLEGSCAITDGNNSQNASLMQALAELRTDIVQLNLKMDVAAAASMEEHRGRRPSRQHYRQSSTSRSPSQGRSDAAYRRKMVRFHRDTCKGCGEYHKRSECPVLDKYCNFCHTKGHIVKVCLKARRQNYHH